jgi:carbon monoxide dehydrogenase subunit G
MKLEQTFEVNAPVEEVWRALIDIERVAPCLPGAEITNRDEHGTYSGDFKVKLGPTTAAYRGTLAMESLDEDAHVATMRANGQDKRGQGSAKATIVSRLVETSGVTRVDVETDFAITGKLARFGRGGMIQDISNRLLGEFASCLQAGFTDTVPADSSSEDPEVPPVAAAEQLAAEPVRQEPPEPLASTAKPFSPPRAAAPISGAGLVASVLARRLAPVLLPLVRAARQALDRLERLLDGSR